MNTQTDEMIATLTELRQQHIEDLRAMDALKARIRELEAKLAKRDDDAESWRETVRALNEAAHVEAIDAPSVPFQSSLADAWSDGCEAGIDWMVRESDGRNDRIPAVYSRNPYKSSSCTVQDTAAPPPVSAETRAENPAGGGSGDSIRIGGHDYVVSRRPDGLECILDVTPAADASDPLAPRTYGVQRDGCEKCGRGDREACTLEELEATFDTPDSEMHFVLRHVRDLSEALQTTRDELERRADQAGRFLNSLKAERAAHEQTRAENEAWRKAYGVATGLGPQTPDEVAVFLRERGRVDALILEDARAELQRLRDAVGSLPLDWLFASYPVPSAIAPKVLAIRALLGGGHE